MTADTTTLQYWLNWRVLLCAIWVLISVIIACVLIWKYEGSNSKREERGETRPEALGILYDDESWKPCLKVIHPAWLLAFRILAFFTLLALLITNVVVDGAGIFYYYTQEANSSSFYFKFYNAALPSFLLIRSQRSCANHESFHNERWTFMLITIYFGLGSLLSIYGCRQYLNKVGGDRVDRTRLDPENGIYVPTISDRSEIEHRTNKNSVFHEEQNVRKIAGLWGYVFQIIYQTNAGAVMLTDCVFWFIIFPFLALKDYDLNLILIGMHSVNAFFLLGDTALNSLRFSWFRIAYFFLWTSGFVIFQWLVHASVSIWWPYPFLDLSSPQAPIWYLVVSAMHIPCYAIFPVALKLKHPLLSRWFPQSYHYTERA